MVKVSTENQKERDRDEGRVYIAFRFNLTIGKVGLKEILYRLKELGDPLMSRILEQIIIGYDDLISERLSRTKIYPNKARKKLGRHLRKGDPEGRFCRGCKARKKGYRKHTRKISTVFGALNLRIRTVECFTCGARYCPLLSALHIGQYSRKEMNFEHEAIEAIIDTNYRRLIKGRSIDISLGGVHNIAVGSDIDETFQERVSARDLSGIIADGTGVKQHKGRKGELRDVIGITKEGKIEPLGCFTNTDWPEIERTVKARIKEAEPYNIPFMCDGGPGLNDFLADVAESQWCTWHGSRGLHHSLWQDGLKKKDSQQETDKIKQLIGIELFGGHPIAGPLPYGELSLTAIPHHIQILHLLRIFLSNLRGVYDQKRILRYPRGDMSVSPDGFAGLTRILTDIAGEAYDGKLVLTLEGGYNLEGLRDSVKAVLKELRGESTIGDRDWSGQEDHRILDPVLEKARSIQGSTGSSELPV